VILNKESWGSFVEEMYLKQIKSDRLIVIEISSDFIVRESKLREVFIYHEWYGIAHIGN